ncbi:flagellar hook-length control protein FliK [Neobacillus pocheonensis]|uniref:flagellar hook-length control protein FliK n=1 Tax=Neobacillus pocheonensis TaxID=363869 RepID=UPI003D27A98B
MIQSASLNPTRHKLSSHANPDQQNAGAFMEFLNGLIKETEPGSQTNDLISVMNGWFAQVNEQNGPIANQTEQEQNDENKPQTRNDLIAFLSVFFQNNTDPGNLSQLQGDLHNTRNLQEMTFDKLPRLLSSDTENKAAAPSLQKAMEVPFQSPFSEKTSNQDFDFQPKFDGKEVVFQSMNAAPDAKVDRPNSPKVSVNQFITEVVELLKNHASLKKASEFVEAKFSLTPEKLGDIEVKLSIHKGQVVAHFTAETLLGKESLEAQLSQLRSSLSQQGFQVDKIEVSLGGQGFQHSFSQQEGKSRQEQSQQRFSKKKISLEEFYQSHTTIEDYRQKSTETTINILA